KVTGAIGNIASKVRDFLPFSPPKTGPLMDIMDVKWGETIGAGILKGENAVTKAMDDVLENSRREFDDMNFGREISLNNSKLSKQSKNQGNNISNENNITIHATIEKEEDIDRLARKIDEKLQSFGSRRNKAFGG